MIVEFNNLNYCKTDLNVASKTRNIDIQFVLQGMLRNKLHVFVARFTVPKETLTFPWRAHHVYNTNWSKLELDMQGSFFL